MLTVTGNPTYTKPQVFSFVNLWRRGKGRQVKVCKDLEGADTITP